MQSPNVLSFDSQRVKFVMQADGTRVVEKKTTISEFQQISIAHDYLSTYPIFLCDGIISVLPAPIIGWDEHKLTLLTVYCEGINMEHYLKSMVKIDRIKCVSLLKDFFSLIRLRGFLWGDCAPRNMILNECQKSMRIVDFEKPLLIEKGPVNPMKFARYLRNYSWEEFSCFLFEEEQKEVFGEFLIDESEQTIVTSTIRSARKKKLLSILFGIKNEYLISEICEVEQLMISIATPFFINQTPFWPIELLDSINERSGTDVYTTVVQRIKNFTGEARARELERLAKVFL